MSPAASVLREARTAGVRVHLELLDDLVVAADAQPPAELMARLRDQKTGIVAILAGNACRWCGSPLDWPRPVGLVFADGTAECMACADAEVERIWRAAERVTDAPNALTDPAELMLRAGGLA